MTIKVATLLVKSGGKITHPTTGSQNRPGTINIEASAGPPTNAVVVEPGGQITVGGGAGLPHPFINIVAVGHILIDGLLDAKSTTAGAFGGRIFLESTEGKVTVGPTGVLNVDSTDPGGSHIQIEACAGIEIFGLVNAQSKINGTEIHLFSREFIHIKGGILSANMAIGAGFPGFKHEITLEARGEVTLDSGAIIRANSGQHQRQGRLHQAALDRGRRQLHRRGPNHS